MDSKNVEQDSLLEECVGDTSPLRTMSTLEEMDDSALPPERPPHETSDPATTSFGTWPGIGEDLEHPATISAEDPEGDIRRIVPKAEVMAMFSMPLNPRPHHWEPITETSPSMVDAHFGSAWDGFIEKAAEITSGQALEDDWYHRTLNEDEQGDQKIAGLSSQKSGGSLAASSSNIPAEENRVEASDAAAVPDADGVDEPLLPVPVALARRVYEAIKPRLDRIAEEGPTSWPPTSVFSVGEAVGLLDTPAFPLAQASEDLEAVDLSPQERMQVTGPEAPRVGTRRMTRSSRSLTEQSPKKTLASPSLDPDSLEVEPLAPKERKARSSVVKKPMTTQPQSAPTTHVAPSPSSRARRVALKAPQPPKVSGAAKRVGRKPMTDHVPSMEAIQEEQPASSNALATRQLPGAKGGAATTQRPSDSEAHSSEILGSGVAGPSNSASVGALYPPALAQRIWNLAEAGKYHAAHGLFNSQERFRRITGEAEVQEYLRANPEAGEKLKPLTTGKPRKDLFLCRSRTFWVPTEEKKEGPRNFVLEHRNTDCPVGYATDHNLYKHVYKYHLKKEYGEYRKKDRAGREQKKPAQGKGKARQVQKKPKASKEEDNDYADEGDEEEED